MAKRRGTGEAGRVHEKVCDDLYAAFLRWEDREAEYFERSRGEFERAVKPLVYRKRGATMNEITQMNLAYTEWFMFEFSMTGGMTPVELYLSELEEKQAAGNTAEAEGGMSAAGLSERILRLYDVCLTQRFSRFAIADKWPEEGRLRLVDLRTGKEQVVFDPVSSRCRRWRDGTLAVRIARVGGLWISVGKTALYDRSSYEVLSGEGPGERGEGAADERGRLLPSSGSYFLDLLRDVAGADSPISHTLRVRCAR